MAGTCVDDLYARGRHLYRVSKEPAVNVLRAQSSPILSDLPGAVAVRLLG